MRVIDCIQGSEEWERLRARPTASQFYRFTTPVRGDYAKAAGKYACEIVAKRLGIHIEPPPSTAMEWGTYYEPDARAAYAARTGREVTEVGFVVPDDTDAYGGSPDGLVGDDGLLEIKCPQATTIIEWIDECRLPDQFRPQIQGLLLITGRQWCDFYAWHPRPLSFTVRVEADLKYQVKIADNLVQLLERIEQIERRVTGE